MLVSLQPRQMSAYEKCVQIVIIGYAIFTLLCVGIFLLQLRLYLAYSDFDTVIMSKVIASPNPHSTWSLSNDRYVIVIENAITGEDDYVRASHYTTYHEIPITYRAEDGLVCTACPNGFIDLAYIPSPIQLGLYGIGVLVAIGIMLILFKFCVTPLDRSMYVLPPNNETSSSRAKLD